MLSRLQRIERYCDRFLSDPNNCLEAEEIFTAKVVDIVLDVSTICRYTFTKRPTSTPYIRAFLYYVAYVRSCQELDIVKEALLFSAVRGLERTTFDPPWTITDILKYGYHIIRNVILAIFFI